VEVDVVSEAQPTHAKSRPAVRKERIRFFIEDFVEPSADVVMIRQSSYRQGATCPDWIGRTFSISATMPGSV
jgi:hypothetical protein